MKSSTTTRRCRELTLIATLSLVSTQTLGAPHQDPHSSVAMDNQIAATLNALAYANLAEARVLARQLSKQFPKFALGHLLSAELEATAAFQDVQAAGLAPMNQRLIDLLLEAQSRLQSAQTTIRTPLDTGDETLTSLPTSVIQMGKDLASLLIVDLENSTISHVIGNDQAPTLIKQHYVGSGKAGFGKQLEGDNKTPLGVYTITGKRKDSSLPDLYGSGALTLNYPNALDQHLGRTGYGIWIHGVPHAQRSRSPRSSEGCVTMSNDHLLSLMHQIEPSESLVMLTRDLTFSTQRERLAQQSQYRTLFTNYKKAILEDNVQAIAALYDKTHDQSDFTHSPLYKHYLTEIDASDLTIIMNPSLHSDTQGNNGQFLVMRGHYGPEGQYPLALYWRQLESGSWRIATELRQGPNAS